MLRQSGDKGGGNYPRCEAISAIRQKLSPDIKRERRCVLHLDLDFPNDSFSTGLLHPFFISTC